MGNFLSRLLGNNAHNSSHRNTILDNNHDYQRNTAEGVLSHQTASEPYRTSQTSFKERAPQPPEVTPPARPPKTKAKPKLDITAPKEPVIYKTTFETEVDAAPPHPLEEKLIENDVQFDEIEIETNLFTPEVEDAVIKIQAGVRGYLTRKELKQREANTDDHVNDEISGNISDGQEFAKDVSPIVPPPEKFGNLRAEPKQEQSPLIISHTGFNESQLPDKLTEIIAKIIPQENVSSDNQSVETVIETNANKSIEEHVADVLFDGQQTTTNVNTVVAIEVTKQDIIAEPIETPVKQDITSSAVSPVDETQPIPRKNSTEKVYKTSIDQFSIKRVEHSPESYVETNSSFLVEPQINIGFVPLIEEEREIEIASTQNRRDTPSPDTSRVVRVQEVIPPASPSPIIQVEEQNGTILDEEEAAIRIQAAFRGFQTRRTLSREASPNRSPGSTTPAVERGNPHTNPLVSELLLVSNNGNLTVNETTGLELKEANVNSTLDQLEEHLLAQLISESNANIEEVARIESDAKLVQSNDVLPKNVPLSEENDTQSQLINCANADSTPAEVSIKEETNSEPVIKEDIANNSTVESASLTPQTHQIDADVDYDRVSIINNLNVIDPQSNSNNETNDAESSPTDIDDCKRVHFDLTLNIINTVDAVDDQLESESMSESNSNIADPIESSQQILASTQSDEWLDTQNFEIEAVSTQINEIMVESDTDKSQTIETNESMDELPSTTPTTDVFISPQIEQQLSALINDKPEINANYSQIETAIISNNQQIQEERPELKELWSLTEPQLDSQFDSNRIWPAIPAESQSETGAHYVPPLTPESPIQIKAELSTPETGPSTSEEISSPDDDPEFIGLSPNSPIPIRSSSPNPFGKKRRKGRKSGRRNQ